MENKHPRMIRERKTMAAMVAIYCEAHHKNKRSLCENCEEILNYSIHRLKACLFQEHKPTCGNCTIHCYNPDMRRKAIKVMRFSGPRMMLYHPIMALYHFIDSYRKPPKL